MDEYSAYESDELAQLYDAVYADVGDTAFWLQLAEECAPGPLLELGCGTGRLLVPLARAGHEVTGIDLASHMLARCRAKLAAEQPEVRERATVLQADMTDFDLDRRFGMIYCPFGSFHHLRTAEQQLASLECCRTHLRPGGRLVLDLINPDPARASYGVSHEALGPVPAAEPAAASGADTGAVDWTEGRRVRASACVTGSDHALQCNDCQVVYEITAPDGTTRHRTETLPMRFIFRFELEHLLARSGFRIVALYGDYDRSPLADESLGMIVVAEKVASEVRITAGYVPGVIGRVTELHATYYEREWGFGPIFETKVAAEMAAFVEGYDGQRDGIWVARLGDGIEGAIAIDGTRASADGAHLRWFIVSDALRGNGVGQLLIDRAIAFSRSRGYERIYLWTFEGLDPARHLYEKNGFALVAQQSGARWGREVNEQRFELLLG